MELYGYLTPSITSSLIENSKVQAMEDHIKNQQQVLQLLKDNLTLVENQMKQYANQHCREKKLCGQLAIFMATTIQKNFP